jgi:hypothetical protein
VPNSIIVGPYLSTYGIATGFSIIGCLISFIGVSYNSFQNAISDSEYISGKCCVDLYLFSINFLLLEALHESIHDSTLFGVPSITYLPSVLLLLTEALTFLPCGFWVF